MWNPSGFTELKDSDIEDPFISTQPSRPASPHTDLEPSRRIEHSITDTSHPDASGHGSPESNWSKARSRSSSCSSVQTVIYSPSVITEEEPRSRGNNDSAEEDSGGGVDTPHTPKTVTVSPFRRYHSRRVAALTSSAAPTAPNAPFGSQPAAPIIEPGTFQPPTPQRRTHSLAVSPSSGTEETATASKTSTSTNGRRRARSNSIRGDNPAAVPISPQEADLAALVRSINDANAREAEAAAKKQQQQHARRRLSVDARIGSVGEFDRLDLEYDIANNIQPQNAAAKSPFSGSPVRIPGSPTKGHRRESSLETVEETPRPVAEEPETAPPEEGSDSGPGTPAPSAAAETAETPASQALWTTLQGTPKDQVDKQPEPLSEVVDHPPLVPPQPAQPASQQPPADPRPPSSGRGRGKWKAKFYQPDNNMSYPNYLDSPQNGIPASPRQAPPSPSPSMNHANGMNGMGLNTGMVGFPTPAGHQADLNFVMSMVEELSRTLEHNRRLTQNIVEGVGRVRERAKDTHLTNDELIASVAAELNEGSQNLEKENAELRDALDKAEYGKQENWKLVVHSANVLSSVLEQMHEFKAKHESDTLAWHKNYRKQLSDEREINLELRNQINDMKASAGRANEWLRKARRSMDEDPNYEKLRIENIALRQERRFWKRKALPMIPDDDPE
ncbi:hypothetical protein DH86_00004099, partial [Scytalidium sp. 3C]